MICPTCGGQTIVTDSRPVDGGVSLRRRRRCMESGCAYRFTTYEMERDGAVDEGGGCRQSISHLLRAARELDQCDLRLLGDIARRLKRYGGDSPVSDISRDILDINPNQRTPSNG